MQKSDMILPLIASIGVGAATYYSITKNNQGIGQALEKAMPFNSQTSHGSNSNGENNGKLGTFGMS